MGTTRDYQEQTGCLNFLSFCTRPDITYTVMRLCEANAGPSEDHWKLNQHLWRYLGANLNRGLKCGGRFPIDNLKLCAYGDASFANDLLTRASVGGHVVMLASTPVAWRSKKQTLVTLSTSEAEFVNLTPTAKALYWARNVLEEAGFNQPEPQILFTDSANARHIALNPAQTARTYHLDLRHKWIISAVAKGDFHLVHVASKDMVADGLTKGLDKIAHERFVQQLGMASPPK